ncbi:hypothetical protein ACKKBF_B00285 [Auxenochlorella protothecoides x Auxenochlorella symbiontica]
MVSPLPASSVPEPGCHAVELTMPANPAQCLAVEFPGVVENPDKALAMMGGLEAMSRHLQENPMTLPLYFRPEDPYCHPVVGNRTRAKKLAVRLRRSADGEVSAAVIGVVKSEYRFLHPADMQYVQSDTRPCEAASLPSDAIPGALPPGFDREPLCTLPPAFLRGPVYEFYHTAAASLQERRARQRSSNVTSIRFSDPQTPRVAGQGASSVPEALRPALAQLSLLLDAKPVWTPASLMEKIAPLPASDAAALLPHLCYKFRSGPWKGAWVRRAYDPRAHPEARRLQTLAYELPEAWWQRLVEVKAVQKAQAAEEAPAGPAGAGNAGQEPRPLPLITPPPPATWAQLHSFQALPSQRTTLFQVGEIDDGEVQALLNDASNFSESLCEAAGWYTPSSWSAVKAAVAAQFGKLIDSGFNGHFRWTTS